MLPLSDMRWNGDLCVVIVQSGGRDVAKKELRKDTEWQSSKRET